MFADGFAFRLTLYSGRDEALLARLASDMLTRPAPGAATTPAGQPQAATDGAAATPASTAVSPESLPLIRNWHHGLIQVPACVHARVCACESVPEACARAHV